MQNFLVVLFLLMIPSILFGQQDSLHTDLGLNDFSDDAYIPDTLVEVHNALKIDPLQIVRGEIAVFYERRISNRFSIELGAGITRRSWTYSLFHNDVDDLRRNITIQTQPAIRAGLRYYFAESPELNGLYIMPQVAWRVFKKNFAEMDSTGELTGRDFTDQREVMEVNLTIGLQRLSYNSNFFYDVYLGVGYGFVSGVAVKREFDEPGSIYYTEPRKSQELIPIIGVKVGWGF